MNKTFGMILTISFLLSASLLWGDSELLPEPYVKASWNGKYYFKMIPDEEDSDNREKGKGMLYKVNPKGPDEIMWKTSGWYGHRVYVSPKGEYLVRMGDWPRGRQMEDHHLGIAFYKNGRLIKSYSTKDLIKNTSLIEYTVSHYRYLKEVKGFDGYSNIFTITTIDNIEYEFNVSTGEIVSEKLLNKEYVANG